MAAYLDMESEIDSLKKIKRLEVESGKSLDYAKENAVRLVREADERAKYNEEKAAREAKEDYEEAIKRAKSRSDKEKALVLKQADDKIKKIRKPDESELLGILEGVLEKDL